MVSPTEGWAVGEFGSFVHWDGVEWIQQNAPAASFYFDIDMISADEGWAVSYSAFLHYPPPTVTLNYFSGAPGSYFSVTGENFPTNETAAITVNGHVIGTTAVDGNGRFFFLLTTANADEGEYYVTASVNPSATQKFVLNAADPVRLQEDTGDTFDVPAGIAFDQFVFLPAIVR
jgi:hypothetical protein